MTAPDARHGYAVFESVVPESTCAELSDALERAPGRARAAARHVQAIPTVRQLAEGPALLGLARRFLGDAATPFRATLFSRTAGATCLVARHQHTTRLILSRAEAPGWGPWSRKAGVLHAHAPADVLARVVALRVHLDPSGPDNGPLRTIPGSHSRGLLSAESIRELVRSSSPVLCLTGIGGVVAMRPLLVHSSSKSTSSAPRRVLHIEYASTLEPVPGLGLAVG